MTTTAENCGCPPLTAGVSLLNSSVCSGTIVFMALLESLLKGKCDIATPCERIKPVSKVQESYDFVVVGAGTAGSLVAGRLSEVDKFKVLLLEAGGDEPIGVRPPSFYGTFISNPKMDWSYHTETGNYCLNKNKKGCGWVRGKVLGGSSALNGMMYCRGHPADYENWVEAGAPGWSWKENLPYFLMSEGNKEIGSVVSAEYHSSSGPMPVKRFNYQPPFLYELLKAVNETGLPIIQDMNDPSTPEGFNIAQAFNFNGQRYTTARAFLSQKPNLDVALNVHVSKVLTKKIGEDVRAVGVQYYDEAGNLKTVLASKEVILSAGALNSPQILLLSGIGPKDSLKNFNIPFVKDLPVGQNLRNHVGLTLTYRAKKIENIQYLDKTVLNEYLKSKDGPMSSTGITQFTGFLYSSLADRKRNQPDLQFFFGGFPADCSKTGEVGEKIDDLSAKISTTAVALQPRSIGYLTLRSENPFDAPLFFPEYLSDPDDIVMVKDGVRYLQRIFETDIMKNKYGVELDLSTTKACEKWTTWSDEWIECMIHVNTDPQNHQGGTAAIGLVIDTNLRVYDIPNLRVIDASSMPRLPTGNPQAAIMMIAERGAASIKSDWL